jgi:transposase-like protein
VKGKGRYLYRAVDSTGLTIDFLLTMQTGRNAFPHDVRRTAEPDTRVVNVGKHPVYPAAIALRVEGTLPRRVSLAPCKYLNNFIE